MSALVLIHEWWGLNDHIKSVAERFRAEGFSVNAVDLYGGKVAKTEEEASAAMQSLDWGLALSVLGKARAAAPAGEKVGVLGFCMGGALALAAAAHHPFDACVPFYGIPGADKADLTKIRAKVLGHFAQHDDWCSPARVDALEKKLQGAGVDVTVHRYDAQHAFFNDTRPAVHSASDARIAFERTVKFLRAALH